MAMQAFEAKRAGASANYSALRSSLAVVPGHGTLAVGCQVGVAGCVGPAVAERAVFSPAAQSGVRGFLEGERVGDQAVRLSFELTSPGVKLPLGKGDWRMTGLAFVDEARLKAP